MWILIIGIVLCLAGLFFEFRIRKPGQLVLIESKDGIRRKKARLYPRHFCLSIPASTYSSSHEIEAEAKGKLKVSVKLSVTATASVDHLTELIRIGGWEINAVKNSMDELSSMLQGSVREFTEKHSIEELSAEKFTSHLQKVLEKSATRIGLELVSIHVQSIEPDDKKIAETIRSREAALIQEETEAVTQKARIASAKARSRADDEITRIEHEVALKQIALKREQEEKEIETARMRLNDELERRRLQLDIDEKEVALLKNNPELILLTPQAAKLAEASQSLPNARTIVSLSQSDLGEGAPFLALLKNIVQSLGEKKGAAARKAPAKPSKKE